MTRKETRWLVSLIMSIVMLIAMIPAVSLTAHAEETDQKITYVNSDGTESPSQVSADGFCYRVITDEDDSEGIEILGIKDAGATLDIPEKIDGKDVISFAIDPRWPVWDEIYDAVETVNLPKTIRYAHSKYFRYFQNLKAVNIAAGGDYYKSENGVLFKKTVTYEWDEDDNRIEVPGCKVAVYPRNKADKEFVMPSDMNRWYRFFEGCPVESITISKSLDSISYPGNLDNLKEFKVEAGNPSLYAKNGVLFNHYEDYDWVWDDDKEEEVKVTYNEEFLYYYPNGKTDTEYTVPDGTTNIRYSAFTGNTYLKKLTLPESVTTVSDDAFWDTNIDTIEFKAQKAPETDDFEPFWGLRDRMYELDQKLTIKYPAGGAGYEEFINWMKGTNYNYWDEKPYLEYEEIPLGSRKSPLYGYAGYGNRTKYTVYSQTKDGKYSKELPSKAGTWYAKFVVDATEDYTGLESDPFEYKVVEIADPPASNGWTVYPGDYYARYGEELIIDALPDFGKVDEILYKESSKEDVDANWSKTMPTEPGTYDYKLIVNGTDTYEGIIFNSKDDYSWITIEKIEYDIDLECDDVLVGETPKPELIKYEYESYKGIDFSKVEFKYYDEVYDSEEEDWKYVEIQLKDMKAGTEYRVKAVYDDAHYELNGSAWFHVRTKPAMAEYKIDMIHNLKYLVKEDKAEVEEARAFYDSLTDAEKKEVDPEMVQQLEKLEKKMANILAQEEYELAKAKYEQEKLLYDAAQMKADESKAAADAAVSKSGKEALAAAEQAKKDAEAASAAADKVKAAADDLKKAAEAADKTAAADPSNTRLDKQNAGRADKAADEMKTEADTKATETKTAVTDAQSLVEAAEAKVAKEEASKAASYKVGGFKAKALKGKKAKFTWKANKAATGYQIQYSLKKNMKKAKKLTVKKATLKKATAKKLKKGKKYFARMRTFTKVTDPQTGETKTIYGKWTRKKSFKAK